MEGIDFSKFMVLLVMVIIWAIMKAIKPLINKRAGLSDYIPLMCAALGVLLNVWINNWVLTPQILAEGLVSGLAATGLNEVAKIPSAKANQ